MSCIPYLTLSLCRVLEVGQAAHATWPEYLDVHEAFVHAGAAVAAETPDIPAGLMLSVAREETHFDPSHVGVHRNRKGQTVRFCGVMQTQGGTSHRKCLSQLNVYRGYAKGSEELTYWFARSGGRLDRTLAGHGCGTRMSLRCGSHGGRKRPYPARVLGNFRRIRKAMGR